MIVNNLKYLILTQSRSRGAWPLTSQDNRRKTREDENFHDEARRPSLRRWTSEPESRRSSRKDCGNASVRGNQKCIYVADLAVCCDGSTVRAYGRLRHHHLGVDRRISREPEIPDARAGSPDHRQQPRRDHRRRASRWRLPHEQWGHHLQGHCPHDGGSL